MNKSRRMGWAWYVARMGRRGMYIRFWWENQKERDVHGWIILKCILKRDRMGWYGLD
jgi:hypothetical protein